jgi:hypothetical protein
MASTLSRKSAALKTGLVARVLPVRRPEALPISVVQLTKIRGFRPTSVVGLRVGDIKRNETMQSFRSLGRAAFNRWNESSLGRDGKELFFVANGS